MYVILWLICTYRLATYEELYRRIKAQAVENYKAALNEQVYTVPRVLHSL